MTNRYAFFEGHKKSKERQYCLRAFKLPGIYSSMVHSLLKDGSNTQNILTSILFSSQLSVCIPVLRNSEWTHLYFIHRFSYQLILWTTCTCISVGGFLNILCWKIIYMYQFPYSKTAKTVHFLYLLLFYPLKYFQQISSP